MHEAWGSESLSFSIVIIELSHSKEFWMAGTIQNSLEWPNPAGSTVSIQPLFWRFEQ